MQHQLVIDENKQKTEKLLSYTILYSLCHLHQRKLIKTKFNQLRIYFNGLCQVHYVEKIFFKTWTFDCSSPQYRDGMVYKTVHCPRKKSAIQAKTPDLNAEDYMRE